MVTLDDLLGHGEADAQAASFAGAAGIGAPKRSEERFSRNAETDL